MTLNTRRAALLGLVALLAPGPTRAGDVPVEDLAWLEGHWRGEGLGGTCEEIWSAPEAGAMMGVFRLIRDGEVRFYEIVLIHEDAEGLALKVKHFTPDFVGWEEKERSVRFAFQELDGWTARFDGLTLSREGDRLRAVIRLKSRDGTLSDERIEMRRVRP